VSQVRSRKESLYQNLKNHHDPYIQSKSVVHTVMLEMHETAAMNLHNLFIFYFSFTQWRWGAFLPHLSITISILHWKVSGKRVVIYSMPLQVN